MRGQRRLAAVLVGASLIGGGAGLVWGQGGTAAPAIGALDTVSTTGRGESLVVVVAGAFPTERAAQDRAQALSFGGMQGFYVDSADNYELLGIYDQLSPDLTLEPCGDALPGQACPPGVEFVRAYQPVELTYVPREKAAAYLVDHAAAPCGAVGQPACMIERVRELLASPDVELAGGTWLVLTAFRTLRGAEEFVELSRSAGYPVSVLRVRKLGGPYVGLGQEAHPDGVSGPLLAPLPDQERFQE